MKNEDLVAATVDIAGRAGVAHGSTARLLE